MRTSTLIWMRACTMGALVCASVVSTNDACAQNSQDKAAADVLFQQGKKAMQEGKFAEACPKLAESLRLDVGIGTMLWLADCYDRVGKTASAWAQFQEAAETAGRQKDAREKVARQRASALEPKLVKLKIDVPSHVVVTGLEIKRDGSVLGKPLWGTAVPVDPGGHAVRASAPGFATWEGSVDVNGDGKTTTLTIPELRSADSTEATATTPAPEKKEKSGSSWSTQRTVALVAAGVGVIGLGAGAVFGLSAKSKLDDSNADGHCRADNHCDAFGVGARSDSKDAATLSTVFFLVGGAALAGGAVLWFTAPKAKTPATTGVRILPRVGVGSAGLDLSAQF